MQYIFETAHDLLMKISSVIEDVIWHKQQKNYSFIIACRNGASYGFKRRYF